MRRALVVLALSTALFAVAGCTKGDAAGAAPCGGRPPPEGGVVVMNPGSVPIAKDLVGRLSAFRSADVRARVPGVLQRRVYEEGSDVRKGQALFQIDPAPLQAVLAQAEGALAQARANAANSKASADRARGLIDGKFISRPAFDNALAAERSRPPPVHAAQTSEEPPVGTSVVSPCRSPCSPYPYTKT